ncbi:MAG TPA: hypothetical protein PLV13_09365 [Ilumatobacteraceae bacterium]|nr:hypothetical protein [Ilumatobacteraceae bacterium]
MLRTRSIALIVGAAVVAGVLIAVGAVWVFQSFLTAMGEAHDHRQFDDPAVIERIDEACTALFTATDAADDESGLTDDEALRREVAAIRDFVSDVQALGDEVLAADEPAVRWLADWQLLAELLDRHTTNVDGARPAMPVAANGDAIARRIGDVPGGCSVPLPVLERFDLAPLTRESDDCVVAHGVAICPSPQQVAITGLLPGSNATVLVRTVDDDRRQRTNADDHGELRLDGVDLQISGTVVIVDGVDADGERRVWFAA